MLTTKERKGDRVVIKSHINFSDVAHFTGHSEDCRAPHEWAFFLMVKTRQGKNIKQSRQQLQ